MTLRPGQLAFLEGGRYHPLFLVNPTDRPEDRGAAFACPRCHEEVLVADRRIQVRPGHPREIWIADVRCRCGWHVDIRGGLCYERDLDPWDARTPTNDSLARRRRGLVFPAGNTVQRTRAACR